MQPGPTASGAAGSDVVAMSPRSGGKDPDLRWRSGPTALENLDLQVVYWPRLPAATSVARKCSAEYFRRQVIACKQTGWTISLKGPLHRTK